MKREPESRARLPHSVFTGKEPPGKEKPLPGNFRERLEAGSGHQPHGSATKNAAA
jgi:hypothetical protein